MNTEIFRVPLDQCRADPSNARQTPHTAAEIEAMARSLAETGLLQPIVVRPAPQDEPGWWIVIGNCRVAAARQLGWTEIDAQSVGIDATTALRISVAENVRRTALAPVDTWEAIRHLVEQGSTFASAANAIGVEERYARRLALLGHLVPEVIAEIRAHGLPNRPDDLATIATAPHDVQRKAMANARKGRHGKEAIDWWVVARDCSIQRMPLSRAIFDRETAGVVFEEDLFAEPGSEDQFTTTDVAGFMAAQQRALEQRVADSDGRLVICKHDPQNGVMVPPKGYATTYEKAPKRWKKTDPRKLGVCVVARGYQMGEVEERMLVSTKRVASEGAEEAIANGTPARPRQPVTQATLARLAALKTEAIREASAAFIRESADAEAVLRLVLLVFGANNVSINDGVQLYGRQSYSHLIAPLVNPDGTFPPIDRKVLNDVAAGIIARAVRVSAPGTYAGISSGPVAEWIGALVGAADRMPRCDTADILRGYSGDALLAIAREQGINDHGKIGEVRKRMIGNMPGWRPAAFEAVPRDVVADDDSEFEEVEPGETDGAETEAAA